MISIKLNDVEILNVSELDIKVLEYILKKDEINDRVSFLLSDSILSEIKKAKNILTGDWVPKIRERYDSMPTQDNDIGVLIFSQPDYQDKDQQG